MSKKEKFDHPYVVGVIGKKVQHKSLQRKFGLFFKRRNLPFVYLQFKVEPRYLKNLIMCMRLMDVVGLNVIGEYTKKVIPYLDKLHESARVAKRVNIISKKNGRFIGHYAEDLLNASLKFWRVI